MRVRWRQEHLAYVSKHSFMRNIRDWRRKNTLCRYTTSPRFMAVQSARDPLHRSATSRHAVSLHTRPSSSPIITLRIATSFPASGPFLIRIVSGPSVSKMATKRLAFFFELGVDGPCIPKKCACLAGFCNDDRDVKELRLKWKAGNRVTDASEDSFWE